MTKAETYLAIDTSATASAAVVSQGQVLAERTTPDTRSHSEVLAGFIDEVLTEAGNPELAGIFTGVGPGPFTGLRAGIVSAQTMGFAWNVPVHGVMSLDAVAHTVAVDAWNFGIEDFVVAVDARRKEVYWAHYQSVGGQFQRLHGPFVTAPEEVTELPVFGAGAGLYPEALKGLSDYNMLVPEAKDIGIIGELALRRGRGLEKVEPQYLRGHDAEIPKQMRNRAQL